MSRTPASTCGWLATMPTTIPPMRAKPTTRLGANSAWTSRNVAVVHQARDHVLHVVGLAGVLGDDPVQRLVVDDVLVEGQVGRRLQVVRRQVGQQRLDEVDRLASSSAATKWMLPAMAAWAAAPPRSSSLITSPVAAWITSGPAMNMCAVPSTMIDEVGQGRRVGRAAGAGPGDDRDLRHDARQQRVVVEDLAVARERVARLPGCARRRRR